MENRSKAILLASGGLDSTTLAYWLEDKGIDFFPVFFNYGQHCVETEYNTLLEVLPNRYKSLVEVIDISKIYLGSSSALIKERNLWSDDVSSDDLYLPYRSLLFLTLGVTIAQVKGCRKVYSGFINSNHAKEIDCTNHFFKQLEGLLNDFGTIEIDMPFRYLSKYEVAQIGISLKAPIGFTFSCQASSKIPCGACPNCVDRLEALRKIVLAK